MKSHEENAFVIFNGRGINNWGKIDSSGDIERVGGKDIREKSGEIWAENMEILEKLDDSFDIPNEGKYGLVGILSGVKQATEFLVYAYDDTMESMIKNTETFLPKTALQPSDIAAPTTKKIEELLDGLGLKYSKEIERSEYNSKYIEIQYYVAKTEDMLQRMKVLIEASIKEGQTGEATRELGRIFGFPATAIEYYIKRNRGEVPDNDDKPPKKYGPYIHSPENGEMEYELYEQKINGFFRKWCPMSAQEFLKE